MPRKEHKPNQLSGGEQQRVAVARALFNNPSVVLADEPSGNLDSAHAKELHQLFFDLRKELGQTFVIVTHNEELAEMADRKVGDEGRGDLSVSRASTLMEAWIPASTPEQARIPVYTRLSYSLMARSSLADISCPSMARRRTISPD
jgi:ABC-type nitrate/sulfonate/bicarbonate transport system ATPase subunit